MNCSSFERWLDAGMPEAGATRALAHAGGCRVCAPALAEARAVEAALRAEAPGAAESPVASADLAGAPSSSGFVDAVMARVEAEASVTRSAGRAVSPGEEGPTPWWLRLAADPVSVISVTLALVAGALAALRPEWVATAAAGILAFGQRTAEDLAAWPALSRPSPTALAAAAALAPLLAFVAAAVYRYFERALVLMAAGRRR